MGGTKWRSVRATGVSATHSHAIGWVLVTLAEMPSFESTWMRGAKSRRDGGSGEEGRRGEEGRERGGKGEKRVDQILHSVNSRVTYL